jgi:hypothetical protein
MPGLGISGRYLLLVYQRDYLQRRGPEKLE